MPTTQNERASFFRSLHQPGSPLVLTNVYDPPSARAVAALDECKALATASYAIAEAAGMADQDLDFETNLRGIRLIAKVAEHFNKPLTVDLQGGYGDRLEECIQKVIEAGAVGCNLEDVGVQGELYDVDVAVDRIVRAAKVAADCGVPDFVINARSDTILFGGHVEDAITRGKKYLEAGAGNVFIWGGRERGGLSRDEVVRLAEGLEGRLNVSMRVAPGNLTTRELAEIGVARISTGPGLLTFAMDELQTRAKQLLIR